MPSSFPPGGNELTARRRTRLSDNAAMLDYLVFDRGEGDDGVGSWDALAQPRAAHSASLMHETSALLQDLQARWGPPGPLDEGHAWDFELQVRDEQGQEWPWTWSAQGLHWPRTPAAQTGLKLALSLCAAEPLQSEMDQLLTDPAAL